MNTFSEIKILNNTNKLLYISILLINIFIACDPEAEVLLPDLKKQLVVDAWIENGGYANVILTYNTGYFDNLDSASFVDLIDRFAKVTVSDGTNTEILTLYRDTIYFPPFVYKGNKIKGEVGKTYYLRILDKVGIVSATTKILPPVKFDSIWFYTLSEIDSLGYVKGIFKDNKLEKNYYRTFAKTGFLRKRYTPTLISIYNDSYFNG